MSLSTAQLKHRSCFFFLTDPQMYLFLMTSCSPLQRKKGEQKGEALDLGFLFFPRSFTGHVNESPGL